MEHENKITVVPYEVREAKTTVLRISITAGGTETHDLLEIQPVEYEDLPHTIDVVKEYHIARQEHEQYKQECRRIEQMCEEAKAKLDQIVKPQYIREKPKEPPKMPPPKGGRIPAMPTERETREERIKRFHELTKELIKLEETIRKSESKTELAEVEPIRKPPSEPKIWAPDTKCPDCGSGIGYETEKDSWYCRNCKHYTQPPAPKPIPAREVVEKALVPSKEETIKREALTPESEIELYADVSAKAIGEKIQEARLEKMRGRKEGEEISITEDDIRKEVDRVVSNKDLIEPVTKRVLELLIARGILQTEEGGKSFLTKVAEKIGIKKKLIKKPA